MNFDIVCELSAINGALYIDLTTTAEFRFTFADSKNEFGKLLQLETISIAEPLQNRQHAQNG